MSGDTDGYRQPFAKVCSSLQCMAYWYQEQILRDSAACGHTYSEQGIRAHLKRNKKCPVAGCQAVIQDEELERDVEMEVIISRTYAICTRASH